MKIDCVPITENPVVAVREVIGYEFVNENLLRQAFTRRAFAVEYGISSCNEELELLGYFLANVLQHSYGSRGFVFQNVLCYN